MIPCTIPYESHLYSTCPILTSLTAFLISFVTVPVLGFGIKPFGPKILPILPKCGIISGVAIITS